MRVMVMLFSVAAGQDFTVTDRHFPLFGIRLWSFTIAFLVGYGNSGVWGWFSGFGSLFHALIASVTHHFSAASSSEQTAAPAPSDSTHGAYS